MKKFFLISALCLAFSMACFADDDFSLDFDPFAEDSSSLLDSSSEFYVDIGGSLQLGGPFFFEDFKDIINVSGTSMISASFHLRAVAPLCEAYTQVLLNNKTLPFLFGTKPTSFPNEQIPAFLDEMYLQGILGPVVVGGGLKKYTWGRADALSVLDVVNSHNLTDLSILDTQVTKKARPLFYLSAYLPKEMKLDAVFVPVFEGNTYATSGRWTTNVFDSLLNPLVASLKDDPNLVGNSNVQKFVSDFEARKISSIDLVTPKLNSLNTGRLGYAQAGIRYSATFAGYHDFGVQYYYGFKPIPAISYDSAKAITLAEDYCVNGKLDETKTPLTLDYTPYHQIGFDYAAAFGPVNLRAELAVNITHDVKGVNPGHYNPSLAWNLGFDYATPIGLTINLCAREEIALLLGAKNTLYDMQYKANYTDTKLQLLLTQSLLRGGINLNLYTIMHVENLNFILKPTFEFAYGSLIIGFETGFFFNAKKTPNANYTKNNYIAFSLSYNF